MNRLAGPRRDNPAKLNGFAADMLHLLKPHLAEIGRGESTAAVRTAAEGHRACCTGADITAPGAHAGRKFGCHAQAGKIRTNTWTDECPEVAFGGMRKSGQEREIGSCGFDAIPEMKPLAMRIGRSCRPRVRQGRFQKPEAATR